MRGRSNSIREISTAAKVNLAYTRITAPFTGRIGLRLVDPGNIVFTPDTTGVAVITMEQPITVIFPIPEDSLQTVLQKFKAGETLQVEAFDRAQTKKIATGHLLAPDNQIDTTTGTDRLKAVFENKDYALFPNQFVNARLLMETLRGVTVIPSAAIQRSPKGPFVYLVKEDQTVTVRSVKLGPSEGDNVSVEEGITPGDIVVLEGAERLKEGSKVEVQKQGTGSSTQGSRSQYPSASPWFTDLGSAPPQRVMDESFKDLHPPAGCYHAADGGHFPGWRCGILSTACFRPAPSGLSHYPGTDFFPRRQP